MKVRYGFVSNSSTSSFICSTKISLEEIKKLLIELLEMYNKWFVEDCLSDLSFEDVFREPRYVDEAYMETLWGFDLFSGDYWKVRKDNKYVEIKGVSDNSIPYVLFEWIAMGFNGRRYHLG